LGNVPNIDAPDKSSFRRLCLTLKISQFAEHTASFGSSHLLYYSVTSLALAAAKSQYSVFFIPDFSRLLTGWKISVHWRLGRHARRLGFAHATSDWTAEGSFSGNLEGKGIA